MVIEIWYDMRYDWRTDRTLSDTKLATRALRAYAQVGSKRLVYFQHKQKLLHLRMTCRYTSIASIQGGTRATACNNIYYVNTNLWSLTLHCWSPDADPPSSMAAPDVLQQPSYFPHPLGFVILEKMQLKMTEATQDMHPSKYFSLFIFCDMNCCLIRIFIPF